MAESELAQRLGARMKAAAEEKGLNQTDVAEMMDRSKATVSRWFSGQQRPDMEDVQFFAQTVGVSEGWLWTGREDLTPAKLADTVAECLRRVALGEAPSAAFDSMTHEPWHLTPERRRVVDAAAEQLRGFVTSSVPGWDSLSDHERRQALRRLLAP